MELAIALTYVMEVAGRDWRVMSVVERARRERQRLARLAYDAAMGEMAGLDAWIEDYSGKPQTHSIYMPSVIAQRARIQRRIDEARSHLGGICEQS
jgi:hypothetical protein